jgi:predicted amidophosphoribosyltransferase
MQLNLTATFMCPNCNHQMIIKRYKERDCYCPRCAKKMTLTAMHCTPRREKKSTKPVLELESLFDIALIGSY